MGLQSCTFRLSPFSILRPFSKPYKIPTALTPLPCRFRYLRCSSRSPLLARALSSAAAAAPQPITTNPAATSDPDEHKGASMESGDRFQVDKGEQVAAANINSTANLDLVLELYDKLLNVQKEVERLRAERNVVANKMKGKLEPSERQKLIEEGKNLKDGLVTLEEDLVKLTDELQLEAQCVPNMTHPDVPIGGEDCSTVRKMVGKPREFSFSIKDHVQLGKDLELFDFDAASEVSGSKFYYLKNEAVLLEMGLVNWAVSEVMKRGFTPLTTPEIVRSSVVEKCGFQPRGTNTQVAEEVVETVPSVAAGPSGDGAPKLDGVPEAEQEDCTHQEKDENGNILDDENSLATLNCCQQIVQLKSNDARSDVEVVNKAEISHLEMDMGALRGERGRKPSTLIRPEEGYVHTWEMGGKGFRKLSYDSNNKEKEDSLSNKEKKDLLSNNKEKKDLLVPSEPEKPNIPSDSSQKEFDSVNEGSVGKRRRSKKKETLTNEHDDQEQLSKKRRKILQTKAKERGPDAPKSRAEKIVARLSTFNIEKGEGNGSGTKPEGKDEFLPQELSGKEEIKDEIISPKRESGDDAEQMVESPMAGPAKAKKPDNLAPETEKKPTTPSVDYGEELVNLRIMVWWPIDKTFYTGTVEAFDPLTKKHRIKYDDDEEEVLNLKKERWELFSEKQPRNIQSYQKQEADDQDPSPAEEPVKTQKKMTKRKPGSSRKQHAPTSSIRPTSFSVRPKGEGRGLAKSGDSSSNLESDDKTCEANFSSKDDGENNRAGKKRQDNLDHHKKTKLITPPPEMR
ncbi:UNVERIFIED_CONTAM: Serine--tRNA ligase, chloroplastic/mitochondrial [Sesamum latifolium]|uniref:Serine--tRNA ligase, chloroplastic/mitochondrial n=1 Tax=Sesamum latifolium TaxID=2727402 RepID=A0AAW2YEC4_9LAMI